MFAGNFCPRGSIEADGQLLPINSNQEALFSLYGTAFGGNGRTTFGVPDLSGRVPVNAGRGIGLEAIIRGRVRGVTKQTITVRQMPSHRHVFTPSASMLQWGNWWKKLWTKKPTRTPTRTPTMASLSCGPGTMQRGSQCVVNDEEAKSRLCTPTAPPSSTGKPTSEPTTKRPTSEPTTKRPTARATARGRTDITGQGIPINVLNPELSIRFCIVSVGIYPPRS